MGKQKPGVIVPEPEALAHLPEGYADLLTGIQTSVASERVKALMSANTAMVLMYWGSNAVT